MYCFKKNLPYLNNSFFKQIKVSHDSNVSVVKPRSFKASKGVGLHVAFWGLKQKLRKTFPELKVSRKFSVRLQSFKIFETLLSEFVGIYRITDYKTIQLKKIYLCLSRYVNNFRNFIGG